MEKLTTDEDGNRQCLLCREFKSEDEFYRHGQQGRLFRRCKRCVCDVTLAKQRAESLQVRGLRRCRPCGEVKEYPDDFHVNPSAKNGGNTCKACRNRGAREKYDPKRWKEQSDRSQARLREQIYAAYGRRCACCGDEHGEFLTIDHVNNDGNEHRRRVSQSRVYADIRREGFPATYRILCMNCNWSRGVKGYCPHDYERGTLDTWT